MSAVRIEQATPEDLALALNATSEKLAATQRELLGMALLLTGMERQRDGLLAALKASTNGLRHVTRWNISEDTELAIRTQIFANDAAIAAAERQ